MPVSLPARLTDFSMRGFLNLLTFFARVMLLQAKPQDLAGTSVIALQALIATVAVNAMIFSPLLGVAESLQRAGLEQAVLALALYGGLSLTRHRERFLQLYAALCGTALVIGLVSWPIYMTLENLESLANAGATTHFALLVLHVWSIVVMAHILRHGFDTRFSVGILMSMGYVIVVVGLAGAVFPTPTGAPVDAL